MRIGRTLFRNTPLQRLPGMSAIYARLVRSAFGAEGTTVVSFREIEIEISAGDITTLPTLADGTYESDELDCFLGLVRPGSVVADIGANIGVWSILLSEAVGPTGHVLAFEPSPDNVKLLESNLVRNGCTNVRVVVAAIGPTSGTGSLEISTAGATHRLAPQGGTGDISVDVMSLDSFVEANQLEVDAIKIDIEGFEPAAFEGMHRVLARRPLLLTEFSVPQARSAGNSWAETLPRLLDTYGACEVFDGRGVRLVNPAGVDEILSSNKLLNLLFKASDNRSAGVPEAI